MKKLEVITGIMLTLFLIGMLTLAFNVQPVKVSGTLLEHELVVSITAPASVPHGASLSHNITVSNQGLSNETYVYYQYIISRVSGPCILPPCDEYRLAGCNIPFLQAGDTYTWTFEWTPYLEGIFSVTAYVLPVPGETSIENNQVTKFVAVGVPVVTVPTPGGVGVKAGDWIKIDYTITGWPSGTPYPEWLKTEFLSVEGRRATIPVTMHISDGREQSVTLTGDIAGECEPNYLYLLSQDLSTESQIIMGNLVIPANCTIGDAIYLSRYGYVIIAGETTRTYAGVTRTVVYASFSRYVQSTYYWDKQTGVLVEASITVRGVFFGSEKDVTATAKATETNMWEAAPDTTAPTISIVSPESKTYLVNDVPLTFTVSESTSWIGYSLDRRPNVTITGNTTLSELSDGSHSIIVYAKDEAGNTGASGIIYFSIETKKAEPFPTLIVAAIVIIAVVGAALLVYFAKVKKTTEEVK